MRYILLSFGFLGWVFYEMSGGADFEPRAGFANAPGTQTAERAPNTPDDSAVTRLALLDNTAFIDPAADEADIALETAVLTAIRTDVAAPEPQMPDMSQEVRIKLTLPVAPDAPAAQSTTDAAVKEDSDGPAPDPVDLRAVSGSRVNLRDGPGTEFAVVGRLNEGTSVMVLEEPGDGWVMLQVVPGGKIGWMADWLLTKEG